MKSAAKSWFTSYQGERVFLCRGKSKYDKASYERAKAIMKKRCPTVVDWRLGDMNTVADLAARFLEYHVAHLKGHKTISNYINQFVKLHGKVKIRELTPFHLTAWVQNEEWAECTARNAMERVLSMLNWAVKQGLISTNPCKGVTKPKGGGVRGAAYVITEEEHAALYRVASAEGKRILTWLYDTGCRPGELRLAKKEHYNSQARTIQFTNEAKTLNRTVYLSEGCVRIAEEMIDRGRDYLFLNPRKRSWRIKKKRPWTRSALEDWFLRLKKKAGIERPEVILYSYRHKFATDCIISGMPTMTVAKLMGHSSSKYVEKVYAHLLNRNISEALGTVR